MDSSPVAIQAAATNAELNGLPSSSCDVRFVRDDIISFCQSDTNYYDVVILDPPKLAPTVAGLDRASRKYRVLNREAIRKIDPEKGGMLLTCTCSAAMTQKIGGQFFLETVYGAAMAAKRTVRLVSVGGPSGCHTRSKTLRIRPMGYNPGDHQWNTGIFQSSPYQMDHRSSMTQ